MKKPVVLRIYKGDQLLGVKQFLESQVVIGSSGEVQIPLEGEGVAGIHAAIEERESGHYVCDLGSESGTFKNGDAVLDSKIESGDILKIGEFRIEFYVGVPKPKSPPPPVAAVGAAAAPAQPSGAKPLSEPTGAPASVDDSSSVAEVPSVGEPSVPPSTMTESATGSAETPSKAPPKTPPRVSSRQSEGDAVSRTSEPKADAPIEKSPKLEAPQPTPKEPVQAVRSESAKGPKSSAPKISQSPKESPPQSSIAKKTGGAAAGFSMAGPKTRVSASARKASEGKKKGAKTFAPASRYANIRDYIKPSKGTVVEVLVAWRERVISSYHFKQKKIITMGSHPECDIVLPVFASRAKKVPVLRIDANAVVLVSPEMTGELIRGQSSSTFVELVRQNRMVKDGVYYALGIEQGEMIRLDLGEGLSLIVRYVSDSPKPLVAPLMDLTTSEATGVVFSFVLVAMLWLYMFLYTPPKLLIEEEIAEPMRTALIIKAPPTPAPLPPPPPPVDEPAPKEVATPQPQVAKATPAPRKVETRVEQKKASTSSNLTKRNDPGKSAKAAPNKNRTGPRQLTSPKSGGAIKVGDKEGSQMKSPKRDVTKSGVFSVFGGGGAQDKLAQETSGSGELAGLASAATGRAGSSKNRPGQGLGSELKDTGRGGDGSALEGIAGGIGTTGRGSGNSGYGTGGLGNVERARIVTGGAEESFSGTIDREAIRRVIQNNLRAIRRCYEHELNRNPDLFGKLVLSWEIGEQGRVLGTRVKSNELGNRAVPTCILRMLKTWRFPEPPSNQVVEVAYPFFFSN